MPMEGRIFNIQRFSTDDGPGIRTTVFLKGCPLRCIWCANPESQKSERQLGYRESKCRGCGKCFNVCDSGAISLADAVPFVRIDKSKCTNCGKCSKQCSAGAMKLFGEYKSADDVFREVEKDTGYYARSGGGVTVSGGEPMLQSGFVYELFRKCREIGIETALDTCGYYPTESIRIIEDVTDLVLFDMKIFDRNLHKKYTGVYNDIILDNLHCFLDAGIKVFIRIPLIPNITDTDENLQAIADYIRILGMDLHVDLLPYHNYGENKYKMLGMKYALAGVKRQPDEKLEHCFCIFKDKGIDCALH